MAREAEAKPEPTMPGWKVALSYALAIVFDALKFIFNILVISAPALIGLFTKLYAESVGWSSWFANIAGFVAGGAAAGLEFGIPAVGLAIEIFGIVMASMVGIIGWICLWLLLGMQLFAPKRFLTTLLGLGASAMPIINFLPTFTPSVWIIVRGARKADQEALAAWEERRDAEQKEQRMRAEEVEAYLATRARARANDNYEIHEELPKAA